MATRNYGIVIGSVATGLLGLVVIALLIVKVFFVTYFVIPQNGMYPSLPAGSVFFSVQHPYASPSEVRRGDIVVFTRDIDGRRYDYVWRVVGLPGDTVETAGASLAVNGRPVGRELVRAEHGIAIFRERVGEETYEVAISQSPPHLLPDASVVVPPDQFFVMGDNRYNAVDSRSFGPIPFGTIIGRKP